MGHEAEAKSRVCKKELKVEPHSHGKSQGDKDVLSMPKRGTWVQLRDLNACHFASGTLGTTNSIHSPRVSLSFT